jgi:hypothetical protein
VLPYGYFYTLNKADNCKNNLKIISYWLVASVHLYNIYISVIGRCKTVLCFYLKIILYLFFNQNSNNIYYNKILY